VGGVRGYGGLKMETLGVTERDVLKMPELFLGIAALLIAIVGGVTLKYGNVGGIPTLMMCLIMVTSILVSLDFLKFRVFKETFPIAAISAAIGVLLLVSAIVIMTDWTGWVTLVASILSLYATYLKLFPK
jgi:hypothetical protein